MRRDAWTKKHALFQRVETRDAFGVYMFASDATAKDAGRNASGVYWPPWPLWPCYWSLLFSPLPLYEVQFSKASCWQAAWYNECSTHGPLWRKHWLRWTLKRRSKWAFEAMIFWHNWESLVNRSESSCNSLECVVLFVRQNKWLI